MIVVSNLVSVDGFFEGPARELDWHVVDGPFLEYAEKLLRSAAGMLFGRRTYEQMAAYWTAAPSDPIADLMNTLPKIVFSGTLEHADWDNARIVRGEAAVEVRALREATDGDYVILGSSELVSALLRDGLIDEYRMIVNPIILGGGKPQLTGLAHRIPLRLTGVQQLPSGVVILRYSVAERENAGRADGRREDSRSGGGEVAGARELHLVREFDAPRDLVWRGWTESDRFARWWGPNSFDNPVCQVDARPGGAILVHMRGPDGLVNPMTGFFREVVRPERLVFTTAAYFAEGDLPAIENLNTVTFEEIGERTRLTLDVRVLRATAESREPLQGMNEGWSQSFDKLALSLRQEDREEL